LYQNYVAFVSGLYDYMIVYDWISIQAYKHFIETFLAGEDIKAVHPDRIQLDLQLPGRQMERQPWRKPLSRILSRREIDKSQPALVKKNVN